MKRKIRQASADLNKLFFLFSFLLFAGAAFSQTVTGTVTDADKKPIGNATVQVKGTSHSVVTDDAGRFSINATDNDVLVIS